MAQPTPRADGLRAMREAKYELNQRRMKEEMGKTVARPKPVAAKKMAKKKPTKNSRKRA